jgi:hypothetical protein
VYETADEEMLVEVRWLSFLHELPAKLRNIIGDDPNELVETDTLDDIPAGSISEVVRIANSSRFDSAVSSANDYVCRCLITSESNAIQKVNPRTIRERGLKMSEYKHAYTSLLNKESLRLERDVFSIAVQRLHISVVPQNLPCRDREKTSVTEFIKQRICNREISGPLFLCGMPGTGKTATVLSSINALRNEVANGALADFNFTEINCLHLKHPIDACKFVVDFLLYRYMVNQLCRYTALERVKWITRRGQNSLSQIKTIFRCICGSIRGNKTYVSLFG